MRPVPSARRLLLVAVMAITVLAALALPGLTPSAHAAGCGAAADRQVSRDAVPTARKAVRCLLNGIRRDHGLRPLRGNRKLRRAAVRHSRAMVRDRFFAHVAPSGRDVLARVRTAGYLRSAIRWTVGENIGWGQASLSTPRAMVRAWMGSPGHRANILSGAWRDLGIGIVEGTPVGGHGGTFTTDFGARG